MCGFEVITGSQFIRSIPLFCLIHRFILFLSVRVCDVFTNDWRSLAPFCHSMGSLPFALYSLIYRQKFIKRENFCQRIFFKCGDKWWSTVDCCPSQIHQKFERRQYLCKEKYTKSFFLLDWPARIFSHLFFTNLILTQFLFAQSELKPKCRKQITSSEIHKFFRKKWLRSALFLVNKNYDDTRKKTDNHVNSLGWSSYFWMYTT